MSRIQADIDNANNKYVELVQVHKELIDRLNESDRVLEENTVTHLLMTQ